MKERPILFSGPMVRALLSGAKTQTRRVVKPQPFTAPLKEGECYVTAHEWRSNILRYGKLPYGKPGDRLWVRETWQEVAGPSRDDDPEEFQRQRLGMVYCADWDKPAPFPWRPSIHMFRWMSRITLEIVSVRVERLQDISEADAKAEGCKPMDTSAIADSITREILDFPLMDDANPYRNGFALLWDSINGKKRPDKPDISWAANPWVWVVEFRRLEGGDA